VSLYNSAQIHRDKCWFADGEKCSGHIFTCECMESTGACDKQWVWWLVNMFWHRWQGGQVSVVGHSWVSHNCHKASWRLCPDLMYWQQMVLWWESVAFPVVILGWKSSESSSESRLYSKLGSWVGFSAGIPAGNPCTWPMCHPSLYWKSGISYFNIHFLIPDSRSVYDLIFYTIHITHQIK